MAYGFQCNTAPIVRHGDQKHARAVARRQLEDAFRGLSGLLPLGGRFDSVVDGIAQEMIDRSFEPLENVAVDGRGLAGDLQPRGFPERVSKVPGHAWKHRYAVREWPHPAVQNFLIQARRQAGEAAIEQLEFFQTRGHGSLNAGHAIVEFIQTPRRPFV